MKYIAMLIIFALAGFSSSVQAQQVIGGTVAAINTVTLANYSAIAVVGATGLTDQKLFDITIENNDPDAFTVSLHSANEDSKLRHSTYTDGLNDGTVMAYTYDLQDRTGTLGSTEPTLVSQIMGSEAIKTAHAFNLATEASVALVYNLDIDAAADTSMFSGSWSDTITVEIANN